MIKYGYTLFTTSILSQIAPDLISVGTRKVGKYQVLARRGMIKQAEFSTSLVPQRATRQSCSVIPTASGRMHIGTDTSFM